VYLCVLTLPLQVQVFLKNEILPCVADPVVSVRHTAGTIITTIVTKEDFTAWPNLLPTLVQLLDSPDFNQVEGAFNTLFKLCEDNTRKFDLDAVVRRSIHITRDTSTLRVLPAAHPAQGRPLNYIIPKLLSFFQSPNDTLRQYAIGCINQFLLDMPAALSSRIDQYLQV
jgi:transportin-1